MTFWITLLNLSRNQDAGKNDSFAQAYLLLETVAPVNFDQGYFLLETAAQI